MTTFLDCIEHSVRYSQARGCHQCRDKAAIVKLLEGRLVGLANGEIRRIENGLIELLVDGKKRKFKMDTYETVYLEAFLASANKLERGEK